MQQTPVHEQVNPTLLEFLPRDARRVIEIGCSSGALAREFRKLSPGCHYVGMDIDPAYVELARRHCDECVALDIEAATEADWQRWADRDCWVFGDTLEHLRDPWAVLRRISSVLPTGGSVVACIPNAQHWSLQVRLSVGDFRYQDSGLLDRTHLRWFTRQTIHELFAQAQLRIVAGAPRIFNEPGRDAFLSLIGQMARAAGADPQLAMNDSMPLQYVVRAMRS